MNRKKKSKNILIFYFINLILTIMKKSLFFAAAASALMLTACSSENDVVQNAPQTQETVAQAVGFDVYTQQATNVTRAGLTGTMTTSRLQRSEAKGGGFGVYAFLSEGTAGVPGAYSGRTAAIAPNFMVNEKLLWNSVNQGWYYNPLKYWPNETDKDSQNTPATMQNPTTKNTDNLTFFAYAPYVPTGFTPGSYGITKITDNAGLLGGAGSAVEPSIEYTASLTDPNQAVDLLWGVAPSGGLSYTAVNGNTITKEEGLPLIDMTKPNVNTNMKFLFQHALARIGLKAVAAIDQVGAGGTLDHNTKITIKSISLTGYFGETGVLNLDNTLPSVANWTAINTTPTKTGTFTDPGAVVGTAFTKTTITISGTTIAEHLRAVGDHDATPDKQESAAGKNDRVGVTTVKQDVLEPITVSGANADWYSTVTPADNTTLKYSETTPYYTDAACTAKATSAALGNAADGSYFTLDQNGVYTLAHNTGKAKTYQYPEVLSYYDVVFHEITSGDVSAGTYDTYTAYKVDKTHGTDAANIDDDDTFTPVADKPVLGDYVITSSKLKVPYYAAGTYYKRDASYFTVVPTNNIAKVHTTALTAAQEEALRTVTVTIDYYITTEDSKLSAGRAQTENIITKDVVFPSIANGKSYNLNLILGLTSVKMEAEVDDWKVINVNADLPQNTDGE